MTDLSGQYLGRYYLLERLGEGGMAVVYKAYDTRLERDVAIKIIRSGAFPPDALGEVLKRFEREAKSLAKLSHPNIVKVYDYGEHEGSPYLVMEYLPGGTLKKILDKPVPWQEAIRLILPVARGVAYAHQRGVLHRDIKPANILITESGDPMLSDFGIAKIFEGNQTTVLTGTGIAIGTPEYMAPEQWTGTTSPQSDLYSLGIVLYEMLTGRKPYIADTPAAILLKQATEPLPNPRKFAEGVPEALGLVLVKALAREQGNRYKDLSVFINVLEDAHVSMSVDPPKVQPDEETHQVPSRKPVKPASTRISPQVGRETVHVTDEAATRNTEGPLSRSVASIKTRFPIRFSYKGIGLLIGGVIIVLMAWMGLPLFGKWLSTAPVSTELAKNITIVAPSKTNVTSQTLTEDVLPTTIPVVFNPQPDPSDYIDSFGVPMRFVLDGYFTMGDNSGENEQPIHQVRLDGFYIDKYEVTYAQYNSCVDAGGCKKLSNTNEAELVNHPVVNVDWFMARSYCSWRSGELPTEAQWEKAARGVVSRTYPWGEEFDCSKANSNNCVGSTVDVGSYEDGMSPYGVYDMAGNVAEWVFDWFSVDYYSVSPKSNPLGPASPGLYVSRVIRGGNYTDLDAIRTWHRNLAYPGYPLDLIGFRCAKDAIP